MNKNFYTKSRFLLATLLFGAASTLSAQTDITPNRYKFNNLPVGPYTIDKIYTGANATPNDPEVISKWNAGFVGLGQPNLNNVVSDGHTNADLIKSAMSVIDMGGQVGKVLAIKGNKSTFEFGPAGLPGFNLGWWNIFFFTDPATTPYVKSYIDQGFSEADAKKMAKVRMRITFHMHENTIDNTNPILNTGVYTFTGTPLNVGGQQYKPPFKSADCSHIVFDEETEEEVVTYDPTKWVIHEVDFIANEVNAKPLRFTLFYGSKLNISTVLIKSIEMIANPTGDPVEKKFITLESQPTSAIQIADEKLKYAVNGNQVTLLNAEIGSQVYVYSVSGQLVKATSVVSDQCSFTLSNKGIYIVKAGNKTIKLAI